MANNYWKKVRSEYFPKITDWSDAHDELRKCPDQDWFTIMFFDVRIYALIQYTVPIQMIILGTILLVFFWMNIMMIIGLFFVLYFGRDLYRKWITRKAWYGTNLYDVLLRDYSWES